MEEVKEPFALIVTADSEQISKLAKMVDDERIVLLRKLYSVASMHRCRNQNDEWLNTLVEVGAFLRNKDG